MMNNVLKYDDLRMVNKFIRGLTFKCSKLGELV